MYFALLPKLNGQLVKNTPTVPHDELLVYPKGDENCCYYKRAYLLYEQVDILNPAKKHNKLLAQ